MPSLSPIKMANCKPVVLVGIVTHNRASILRKLNLDSVAGVVRYAIRNKIIEA